MPLIAQSLLVLLGAYLLGSLSGRLLSGRLRGRNIHVHDSAGADGTHALRTQGAHVAFGLVLIDVGKGALAAWLGLRCAPAAFGYPSATAHGYAAALAAAVGHLWPLWHRLPGGKGTAPLAGGVLVLWPWVAPLLLLVWMTTVALSGYIGLATVLAGVSLALAAGWSAAPAPRLLFACAAALLLLFTHRASLLRLLRGEESRFERARLLHRLWRPRA